MEIFEIKDFSLGYDTSIDENYSPENSTQDCLNVDFVQEPGAVKKDFGFKVVSSIGLNYPMAGPVQGLYEGGIWNNGSIINKRIVIAGGTAYQYCSGNQLIKLGVGGEFATTSDDYCDVTHFVDKIIITDGNSSHNIKYWTGLNWDISDLDTALGINDGVSTWRAKRVEVFKNRLFIGSCYNVTSSTWYENMIRWSIQGTPGLNGWLTAGDSSYVEIMDKEGDEVIKLKQLFDVLLVFKNNSIHSVTFTGGDIPFTINPIDERSINNAPWSIRRGKGGLFFLNNEGFQFTDGSRVETLPADMKVTKFLRRVYKDYTYRGYADSNDETQEYWIALPIDGSKTCNYIIVYNWKYDTWKILEKAVNVLGTFSEAFAGGWRSIASYYAYELAAISWNSGLLYPGSKQMHFGDSDGYLQKRSIGYSDDGSAYDSYITTPWLDFGKPGIKKEVVMIEPLWKGIAGDYVTISYKKDYEATWTDCSLDAIDTSGVIESPFIYLRATGEKWKFRISNNNADEYFANYRLKIFYNTRGIR